MDVSWGILRYPAEQDRAEILGEWRPFAEATLDHGGSFGVMHGEDRITFRRPRAAKDRAEVAVAVTADPAARARVDALVLTDGTRELFGRLFNDHEVFVPWNTRPFPAGIGTPSRTWFPAALDRLVAATGDLEADPDLVELADHLFTAACLARRLQMLITIDHREVSAHDDDRSRRHGRPAA
ncbi:hypothetical protein [Actinomadura sp. 21ATH]|uniref:hypothetical protein n=1 Tax=Actinomadura sp. 21ATH TaxID=1735444 RepID=UPI0035C0A0B1